jgi:N-acetylglutamate synthase
VSIDSARAWRAERALQMAWPALEQQARGDWLARFAPGVSRRANSANPTRAAPRNVEADIAACEELYRARGLPALFRLPSLVEAAAGARLDRLGYASEGETLTLSGEPAPLGRRDPEIAIAARPKASWLAAMAELQGQTAEQAAVYQRVVKSIVVPAGFASLREEGEWAALAFGALHEGWLCCESVVTHSRRRGRGHARRLLTALTGWGAQHGARGICLQVAADNAPALALYRSLGLAGELYRYHYRREPKAG